MHVTPDEHRLCSTKINVGTFFGRKSILSRNETEAEFEKTEHKFNYRKLLRILQKEFS
jgi:hypothetical protein